MITSVDVKFISIVHIILSASLGDKGLFLRSLCDQLKRGREINQVYRMLASLCAAH